jgi:hypothetical protein
LVLTRGKPALTIPPLRNDRHWTTRKAKRSRDARGEIDMKELVLSAGVSAILPLAARLAGGTRFRRTRNYKKLPN